MVIDRRTLLERANKWSELRYGVRVTDRALSDWVAEELVPGPTRTPIPGKTGSRRHWSPQSYHRVLQICRMRGQKKSVTFDQLRVYLWLRSNEPFDDAIRVSMERECQRLLTEMRRPFRTVSGPSSSKSQNEIARLGELRKRGVDPRLHSFTDHIPPELFRMLIDNAVFLTSPLASASSVVRIASGLLPIRKIEESIGLKIEAEGFIKDLHLSFSGLFHLPEDDDESVNGSSLHSVQSADNNLMQKCRDFCKLKQWMFNHTPLVFNTIFGRELVAGQAAHTISYSLQFYPWNFLLFIMILHPSYRSQEFADIIFALESYLNNSDFRAFMVQLVKRYAANA